MVTSNRHHQYHLAHLSSCLLVTCTGDIVEIIKMWPLCKLQFSFSTTGWCFCIGFCRFSAFTWGTILKFLIKSSKIKIVVWLLMASLVVQMVKNLPASAGATGSIPGLGRSLGEGNGNPLQYSCLRNPMDRGAWRAAVHGVTELDAPEHRT